MRLNFATFHQNYQSTFIENFQFPDPVVQIILTINHDPQQQIWDF